MKKFSIFALVMIRLANKSLELLLHEPQDGYYRGTRFDRSGIAGGISWHGIQMAGSWFSRYDPFAHDAVCGPAEEFCPIGFEQASPGDTFIKIGVGLLRRPDSEPYDRFRLYELADPGHWEVEASPETVVFVHRLENNYLYRKEIVLCGPDCFQIRHSFDSASSALSGLVYNHNFWTFGRMETGPSRRVDFPFEPDGHWRQEYDSVALTPSGIRFSRILDEGESVYMGDIHRKGEEGMPYCISLSEGPLGVEIKGDVPVLHTVFWANHRVACPEPYNAFYPGCCWTITYRIYEK